MKRLMLLLAVLAMVFPALAGATNFGDQLVFEGGFRTDTKILTATTQLGEEDCGKIILCGTDAIEFDLPATILGCEMTFVNIGAAGNNDVEIDPAAADQLFGTCTLAASVVTIAGAAGESMINTKGTTTRGNTVKIVGDGVDGWYITGCTGIWAEASP